MTTSWIKAADDLQPSERRIETARNAGFTSAVVFPTQGIFGGQGSVINLAGTKREDMVLAPSVGQYITMRTNNNGFPNALMGVIAYIRQIYLDADHYRLVKEAYAKDARGMQRPEYDRALEGVLESKRILLPANREPEMDRMLRFGAELKQPTVLYGLREGYHSAATLKKGNATVLVSLRWPEKARDSDPDESDTLRTLEIREKAATTPQILKQAGIKFAFYSDGYDQPRDLNRAVKKAIDSGLSREDAVRALTLSPAEIFGVSDRIGSIEKGKIANLVITRGEIFDDRTRVEMIFIDGVKYLPTPEPAGRGGAPTESQR
jgi:imidazolonepropionase-like amidohydrolase